MQMLDDEEFEKIKCEAGNEEKGNLTGYDCPKCKNRGYYYEMRNKKSTVVICECMKQRKIISKIKESGITKEMFDRFTFENYETTEDYQKTIYSKATSFVDEIKNKNQNVWFYIGSISGIGKTHICTAILKEFLKSNFSCRYFLWKNELPKIKVLKKSYDEEQQKEYQRVMEEITNVEILYIDDFLKFLDDRNKEDLDLAYEIINGRYLNNKITIISSELDKQELGSIDLAICGRISEKTTKRYFIQPKKELDRNYRLKY